MAKLIADVHDLFNFLAGKQVATEQPPERIDSVLYEVIISIYNEHYDHYVKTQKISDYLLPFKRKKVMSLSGGITTLPLDYKHTRYVTLPDGTQVDVIEDKFWSKRITRKVGPVSITRPVCRIEDTGESTPTKVLEIKPASITAANLYYFKTPVRPKWAYTPSGNRYVYDDAASVDVEFGVSLLPQMMLKCLSRFGINLREQQVIQYAEQMKAQESTK